MVIENAQQEILKVDLSPRKLVKNLHLEGKLRRQLNQILVGLNKAEQIQEIKRLYPEVFQDQKTK